MPCSLSRTKVVPPSSSAHASGGPSHRYIVVGAGSAGSALVCELLRKLPDDCDVIVIEHGPHQTYTAPPVRDPLRWAEVGRDTRFSKLHLSKAQSQLMQRRCALPRGIGLGGCGNIHASFHVRAPQEDYRSWPWPCSDILDALQYVDERMAPVAIPSTPLGNAFSQSVLHVDAVMNQSAACKVAANAGFDGEWARTGCNERFRASLRCAAEGENEARPTYERVSPWEAFIAGHEVGQRAIASNRLRVVRGRATRIRFSREINENDVPRTLTAIGICGVDEFGHPFELHCVGAGEVILCAGVFETPKLLLLSGIGPEDHLRVVGVTVKLHLSGVGSQLLEHPLLPVASLHAASTVQNHPSPTSIHAVAVRELATTRGTCMSMMFVADGGASASLAAELILPRFSIFASGGHMSTGAGGVLLAGLGFLSRLLWSMVRPCLVAIMDLIVKLPFVPRLLCCSVALSVAVLDPQSSGSVRLRNSNPSEYPLIDLALLRHPADMEALRASANWMTHVVERPHLSKGCVLDVLPGALHTPLRFISQLIRLPFYAERPCAGSLRQQLGMSDGAFDRFARLHVQPFHHACGSCPAGRVVGEVGPQAGIVVDPDFRVLHTDGLRIADASVFPTIPKAPTAVSAMAIGVLAARAIAGNPQLSTF